QPLRLPQIERIEPFREPAVDRREKIASLIPLALIAPEHATCSSRRAVPMTLLAVTCYRERAIEIRFCFFWIRGERLECDFPGNAMHLGLAPSFLRPFYFVYRVVNTTP